MEIQPYTFYEGPNKDKIITKYLVLDTDPAGLFSEGRPMITIVDLSKCTPGCRPPAAHKLPMETLQQLIKGGTVKPFVP